MRITIIAVVGILSYLLVLLPGYFLFFSEDDAKSEVTELLTEVLESGSGPDVIFEVGEQEMWELLGGVANLVYYFDEMLKAHPKLYQSIRRGEYT
jgi:hypothetical protein